MLCAFSGTLLACASALPAQGATVEAAVAQQLTRSGRADVLVTLANVARLEAATHIADRLARRQFVYDTLTAHATATQAALRTFLDGRGVAYESFWIDNSIHIRSADSDLVRVLAARADVALVRVNRDVPLDFAADETLDRSGPDTVEPNIQRIRADVVWAQGDTGQGVVVASIDTGVRWTHEALVNQYRGNDGNGRIDHDYSWWDPQHNLAEPADNVSHGTHLVGIAVGGDGPGPFANDIGVAPGAHWIAAKGCEGFTCSQASLVSAGQWVACPTRVDGSEPDCSKAPDVVDNGWGGGGGDSWYLPVVNAWRAAGIVPVFSVGASGPACGSVGSPADYPNVIGVGATDSNDVLMSFSGRGPGAFRPLKPDVVAPGENIRSASATSDSAYVIFSGTSMATSHVTGTAALAIAAQPAAGYMQVYRALSFGAERDLGPATTCGGRPSDQFPNFVYGWGRVDAAGAVAIITR
jgi:subtilisin family serine protease